MPRAKTDAAERKLQRHRVRDEVSAELGEDVSIARAVEYRRSQKKENALIPARDVDFSDVDVQPVGVVLGRVDDYRVLRGGAASLRINTSANEFGEVLHDAARVANGNLLAVAIYVIPRDLGLDEEDEDA